MNIKSPIDEHSISHDQRDRVAKKFKSIYLALSSDKPLSQGSGLMGGELGILLFQTVVRNSIPGPKIDIVQRLDHLIENLNQNQSGDISISSGYSGLGWYINFLHRSGYDCSKYSLILDQIDEILVSRLQNSQTSLKIDFLVGMPGYLLYLKDRPIFGEIVKSLGERISHECFMGKPSGYINLGVSHGYPSLMYFFLQVIRMGNSNEQFYDLLKALISVLRSNIRPPMVLGSGSYFGVDSRPREETGSTRLAWCYGDLTISWLLYQSAIALQSEDILDLALEIAEHCLLRTDLEETQIKDAGFCHGTSGVCFIYNKFFKATGRKEFIKGRDYWLEETLKFGIRDDGPAGYMSYVPKQFYEKEWLSSLGLLEGVAGIGLVMHNLLNNTMADWEDVFLLD